MLYISNLYYGVGGNADLHATYLEAFRYKLINKRKEIGYMAYVKNNQNL